MNNPEDQNPMLPNLRDEAVSGAVNFVGWLYVGFAFSAAVIIFWMLFSLARPAKVQPKFENIPMLWTNGVEYVEITNTTTASSVEIFTVADYPARWFHLTSPDKYWHWTNVVFSSTREPVVTKTNGEWRIGFK